MPHAARPDCKCWQAELAAHIRPVWLCCCCRAERAAPSRTCGQQPAGAPPGAPGRLRVASGPRALPQLCHVRRPLGRLGQPRARRQPGGLQVGLLAQRGERVMMCLTVWRRRRALPDEGPCKPGRSLLVRPAGLRPMALPAWVDQWPATRCCARHLSGMHATCAIRPCVHRQAPDVAGADTECAACPVVAGCARGRRCGAVPAAPGPVGVRPAGRQGAGHPRIHDSTEVAEHHR